MNSTTTIIKLKILLFNMKKEVLANGLTVLFEHKKGNSVVIEVMAKVGSNNETKEEAGISHFIEHMLFEGTKKRPNNWLISNEIEKVGGEFNAYTTNERTCFYAKVPKKHFENSLEVIADIIKNSLFKLEDIKREKNVVSKEIDLINDEPRYYQWDLLQKTLFSKHPSKNPVYGDKKVIKNLTRDKLLEYFNRNYGTNNLVVSIVGDIKDWKNQVKDNFKIDRVGKVKQVKVKEPVLKSNIIKKEKKKIVNTYMVCGFKTCTTTNPDAYVLEVINGVLGRGQSGRMFTEIRAKKGLAYDVGTQNVNESTFGYFSVYATIDKKNIEKVKKMILTEIEKLKKLESKDLLEAKNYVEGSYLLDLEDPQKIADQMLFWEQVGDYQLMNSYLKKIKQVTLEDVKRVITKYFKHHALVTIEGK
jgi:predicted Zn-dependent peptidase